MTPSRIRAEVQERLEADKKLERQIGNAQRVAPKIKNPRQTRSGVPEQPIKVGKHGAPYSGTTSGHWGKPGRPPGPVKEGKFEARSAREHREHQARIAEQRHLYD